MIAALAVASAASAAETFASAPVPRIGAAALNGLFDGTSAALAPAADAVPDPHGEILRAASGNVPAIFHLSDAALAAATPDEKLAMLKTLLPIAVPSDNPWQSSIVRILASARDAASFDRVYYRLDPDRLADSVSQPRSIQDLVARSRADAKPGDWTGYLKYLDVVTGSKSGGKNIVQFLIDGPSAIPPVVAAIRGAQHSIHAEVFQLQADEYGRAFVRDLAERAQKGVLVRLMIDDYGSDADADPKVQELIGSMKAQGIQVLIHPAGFLADHLDHRKVLVIDGDIAFTGGMNVGKLYQAEWHDEQTLVMGPAVAQLQDAFLSQWKALGGTVDPGEPLYPPLSDQAHGLEARVVAHQGGGKDHNIKALYMRAIETAQKEIRIATPYFTDAAVIGALCDAARRGVKVQIVLPADNDVAIVQRGSRAFYPDLLAAGVEIYEYQDRMAHEKVAVVDGNWSTFGSSNLDARSLTDNDELNVVVMGEDLANTINRQLFDKDIAQSKRVVDFTPTWREKLDRRLLGKKL